MNTKNTTTALAGWLKGLIQAAKEDESFSVSWFLPTKDEKMSIVGGWMEGFSEDYSDFVCVSKSNPKYAMCVKVVVNEGPYAYCDFETLNMPIDRFGEVDNTCIVLEYNDDVNAMAEFFIGEWERITREQEELNSEIS